MRDAKFTNTLPDSKRKDFSYRVVYCDMTTIHVRGVKFSDSTSICNDRNTIGVEKFHEDRGTFT